MTSDSAWPIKVAAIDEVPPSLGGQLAEQLTSSEVIQQLIYVPAVRGPRGPAQWERTRGVQVLTLTDRHVIVGVQAVRRGEAPWMAIPYDTIVTWELGETLLYGRLDLCGDLEGHVGCTFIEFNTVGLWTVEEALAPLERMTLGIAQRGRPRPLQRSPVAMDLPYKFANFLADALLPGEEVHDLVFQEAVVQPAFLVWRRLVTPGTVIAATDRRLLVIREEPKPREPRYGHSALTLPRRWADRLAIRNAGDWQFLEYMPNSTVLSLPVAAAHADALHALVVALQSEAPRDVDDSVIARAVGNDVATGPTAIC
jgi:hypothetical protein